MSTHDVRVQRSSICGCARTRRTVTEFVLDACRRSHEPLPPSSGDRLMASDGAAIRFHASLQGDEIADVRYEASSCATLIAYAELLGDFVVGKPIVRVAALAPRTLIELLPGVPRERQERAIIVAQAWSSAIATAWQSEHQDRSER
ncbi:MAG: iron-sulfur cluster assembly scaffold protein [Chloroflexi bacterium]|nr:iron-sulfur cluster assembly scaffold protein [Chloroflexota bacterium]